MPYYASLKRSPTEVVHGRVLHSALDPNVAAVFRLDDHPIEISEILDRLKQKYKANIQNIFNTNQKYKTYNVREVPAHPLKITILCSSYRRSTTTNLARRNSRLCTGLDSMMRVLLNVNSINKNRETQKKNNASVA